MAVAVESAPPVRKEKRKQFISDETAFKFLCVTFCLFCFRDMLTGAMRYYLELFHVSALWFVADILSVVVLLYFIVRVVARNHSVFGWIVLVNMFSATVIGLIFMSSDAFALFSSIKLFLPIFCGFAFCGRSLMEVKWVRTYLLLASIVSTVGLLLGPVVDFPWVGVTVDNFGQTKEVGRLIWAQGEMRYGGFAGDNTMAAYMAIFPYIMVYRYLPKWLNIALWIPYSFALYNSNSKTAMLISIVFVIYFLFFDKRYKINDIRKWAKLSFIFVPLPFVLIFALSGVDLSKIDPILFSMQDRINNTWQFPFKVMGDIFPAGIITGCGLGCFTYPMQYTEKASLWVPVDNFYLATYIMFGFPFLITIAGMYTATIKTQFYDKLILIIAINLYCVTVQCYGPSTATIIIGYAFSDMFQGFAKDWGRGQKAAEFDPLSQPRGLTARRRSYAGAYRRRKLSPS